MQILAHRGYWLEEAEKIQKWHLKELLIMVLVLKLI